MYSRQQTTFNDEAGANKAPWLAMFAVAGLTTAAVLYTMRHRGQLPQAVEDVFDACEKAAQALDQRLANVDLALAG
jgi:hypothetical protein